MSRRVRERLLDVEAALNAIDGHLRRSDVSDGLVFDAVRVRLLEIGEAVKAVPEQVLRVSPPGPRRRR